MNNVFKFELKIAFKSAIIWTVCSVFLVVILSLMYPSFQEQAESFEKLLNSFPPKLIKEFNLDIDNFTTAIGFYSFSCIYGTIALSIYSANLGMRQFSNEKKNRIYEYLLTKPITRESIFCAKICSGFLLLLVPFVIYTLFTIIFIPTDLVNNSIFDLININLIILLLMLFFYYFGTMIAIILPKIKVIAGFSIPLVFGFYFLSILKSLLNLSEFKYLTPFSMFVANDVLTNGLEVNMIIYISCLYLLFIIIGFYLFKKQDIR